MSEHPNESSEHLKRPEASAELGDVATEALKQIEKSAEIVAENTAEKLEAARTAIERQTETQPVEAAEREPSKAHHPTKLDKRQAYWQTLNAMQQRLRPAQRKFSKFIHNPKIEVTSETLGKTVFRPSVTLGATATALTVGAFFYITARRYGFVLSGAEFILALIVGGILGGLIELAIAPFRRRKH